MKKMFFSLGVLLVISGGIGFVREAHGQELQGQELPRLAVVEFSSNTNNAKTRQDAVTVRNLVESRMVGTGKYQIITRTDIDRLMDNQQIQVSSISSTENIHKLRLQNISYIVTGSVDAIGDDYAITVKILDVSTGRFSHSVDTFIGSASREFYNGVTQLANAFAAGMTSRGGQVAQAVTAQQAAQPSAGTISVVTGNLELSTLSGCSLYIDSLPEEIRLPAGGKISIENIAPGTHIIQFLYSDYLIEDVEFVIFPGETKKWDSLYMANPAPYFPPVSKIRPVNMVDLDENGLPDKIDDIINIYEEGVLVGIGSDQDRYTAEKFAYVEISRQVSTRVEAIMQSQPYMYENTEIVTETYITRGITENIGKIAAMCTITDVLYDSKEGTYWVVAVLEQAKAHELLDG
ncbi:MAG: CsgG/HfaB family protein [Treponema sp.]|jgi:hypothetical protein|nr:CsgG/HfaB family protein [Treponema sp.]